MAEQTARMRAIDSYWLDAETGGPAVAVGSLVLAEGPPPTVEELRAGVGSRLDRMARLSERAVPSRGPVRRPRWEPVDVDLSYHVREQAVAAPADMGAIEDAVSAVLASPMDLDKPLWDMHLLTGLPVEQFGVVTRLHHAVADGAGSLLLLGHLFDLEPAGGTTLSEFFAAAVTQAAQAQSVSSPAGQESSTLDEQQLGAVGHLMKSVALMMLLDALVEVVHVDLVHVRTHLAAPQVTAGRDDLVEELPHRGCPGRRAAP
jgi:hypothetical protein